MPTSLLTLDTSCRLVSPNPTAPYPGKFKLAAVRAGLSAVLSLEFGPDGLLYALEFSTAAALPTPGTGKVVRLRRDGRFESVVSGLSVPTGMTFGPDNALYISNFGAAPTGVGQILRIALPR